MPSNDLCCTLPGIDTSPLVRTMKWATFIGHPGPINVCPCAGGCLVELMPAGSGWGGSGGIFSASIVCVDTNTYFLNAVAAGGCGSISNVLLNGGCDGASGFATLNEGFVPEDCCGNAEGDAPDMAVVISGVGNASWPFCGPICQNYNIGTSCCEAAAPTSSTTPPYISDNPVRFATGEVMLRADDIKSSGFGFPWGHTRSFASRLTVNLNLGNGYNWQVANWPYLIRTTVDGDQMIAVMGSAGNALYFSEQPNDVYNPQFDVKLTLQFDRANGQFYLIALDGSFTTFDWMTGQFLSHTAKSGESIRVISRNSGGFRVTVVERAVTLGGSTTTEQFNYEYSQPFDVNLVRLTLRRRVDANDWQNVEQVVYTYYQANDPHGASDDLQTVSTYSWQFDNWAFTGTTLYRYYLEIPGSSSSSSSGSIDGAMGPGTGGPSFDPPEVDPSSSSSSSSSSSHSHPQTPTRGVHLLKFVLKPAAYARLAADPSVSDPLTASDGIVLLYSDYYYEYDTSRRVTRELIESASRDFTYAYLESNFPDDYNSWKFKTEMTQPDGSLRIVYCNYAGQPMLSVHQNGADKWCDFWKRDANGFVILHANPSAISGFDDQYADLLHQVNGNFEFLKDHEGLIETFDVHTPTGRVSATKIQQGELGICIRLSESEFTPFYSDESGTSSSSSSSGGSGTPVYFLTKIIVYPDDGSGCDCSSSSSSSSSCSSGNCCSNDGTRQIIMSYGYVFYSGTVTVKQKTTTLPAIPVDQNGSGVAATKKEYYDSYGDLIWTMDERGFITGMMYDIPTGAMRQRIDDVDTGLVDAPAGWSTPSGGGQHLITDYEHDDQGRMTQSLGPTHPIDLNGTATVIRRASWIVYQDADFQIWSAQGFATGDAPDYECTLVNPVSITQMDASGKVLEQISAVRASTSGKLESTDIFPQSSYCRWTTNQYTDCCLAASQRVYHTIPSSGEGEAGTNYNETDYGYDVMKRQNRTVTPGGTITYRVFDTRGQVIATYLGTNDNGATDQDPTGGGAMGNNMVIVTSQEYDNDQAGYDGNLILLTQHVDATTARLTAYLYDWRDRQIAIDGEIDFYQTVCYDNLNRVVRTDRRDTIAEGNLIGRNETQYDDQGRVFRTIRYGVDPTTGAIGNSLTDNSWYDASGNTIKSKPSGSQLFTKSTFDSLGRSTITYIGYDLDESSYSEAGSVTDDVILEQSEMIYDNVSNGIQSIQRKRYHNAPDTQTGPLQDPSSTPKARVTYSAMWPDGIGRTQASADYGTNGGSTLSRPVTIPERSDTILVNSMSFDAAGNLLETKDPSGMVTHFEYDSVGRQSEKIENHVATSSSSSFSSGGTCSISADINVTVLTTYNADGNVSTVTAVNAETGNQTTEYVYGTTLADSDLATSFLKRTEIYPDSTDEDDVILFAYNRQQQTTQITDQGGTVHALDYDLLGRQTQDRVTELGDDVDGTIRRIEVSFDVWGMKLHLTSYDSATVGTGTVLNDCLFVYNEFSQLITEYQSHSGLVNTSTTPKIQYEFADGSTNTIRATSMSYPNGRVLAYAYGTTDGVDDAASRVKSLIDDNGTTHLTDYAYLGQSTFVETDYTEPEVKYTLVGTASGNDLDTGDIYRGLDRFSRIKDSYWFNYGESTATDRIKYGYDHVGSRTYRENVVATGASAEFDELYAYDQVHRLKRMDRGLLNLTKTGMISTTFSQCWTLDEAGNWSGYREDANGDGTWNLIQSRESSPVNEITGITETSGPSWITPVYSPVGNMTTIPMPADPTRDFTATYDAWNRLTKLVDAAESKTVSEYQYDGAKRRVIQQSYTDGTLSETRHLYYTNPSHWQVIEERLGISPGSVDATQQHVWGHRFIDDCVMRDRDIDASGSLDERLYVLQDGSFSVTSLISLTGMVQERFAYSAYGVRITLSPLWVTGLDVYSWRVSYCGYMYDDIVYLHYARYRFLNGALGTWLQRDFYKARNSNSQYEYVNSNPASLIDPLGLFAVMCTEEACNKCLDDAKNDNTLKALYKLGQKPGFLGLGKGWRDGCQPKVKCAKCKEPGLLGDFANGQIRICFNRHRTFEDVPKVKFGKCDSIIETLRHEYVHQLNACLKHDLVNGPETKCNQCFCDEVTAHRESGQCTAGSVWWTTTGPYASVEDCLKKSAFNACKFPCNNPQAEDGDIADQAFIVCQNPFPKGR